MNQIHRRNMFTHLLFTARLRRAILLACLPFLAAGCGGSERPTLAAAGLDGERAAQVELSAQAQSQRVAHDDLAQLAEGVV